MNKRFFTLMAAVMLAGSPFAATEAFAATGHQAVELASGVSLANGLKFKIQHSTPANGFYNVAYRFDASGALYATLDGYSTSVNAESAPTFEVRNLSKTAGGVTFELYVAGKYKFAVVEGSTEGEAIVNETTPADKVKTLFAATTGSAGDLTGIILAKVGAAVPVIKDANLVTVSAKTVAGDLNANLSNRGFKFSFPAAKSQPDDNPFANQMVAVKASIVAGKLNKTISTTLKALDGTTPVDMDGEAVCFAVADEAGLKLLAENPTEDEVKAATFVAVSPVSNFGITGLSAGVGAGQGFMKVSGKKLANDNSKKDGALNEVNLENAIFEVSEGDILNAESEYTLHSYVDVYTSATDQAKEKPVYIGAYSLMGGGLKTFITTHTSAANLAKAQTGGNTYVQAADLLKKNGPAVYNIYFTGTRPATIDANTAYGKYLVAAVLEGTQGTPSTYVTNISAPKYVDLNDQYAQWVVTNVGDKGQVTFQNAYSPEDEEITAKLYKTSEAGVYQINNADFGLTEETVLPEYIKLVPATGNNTFLTLSDEQLKQELTLAFTDDQAVNVTDLYMLLDDNGFVPTKKADKSAAWNVEKAYTVNHVVRYAYLKNNEVVSANDTTKVQTYYLVDAGTYGENGLTAGATNNYILKDATADEETAPNATEKATNWNQFAFQRVGNGIYAMIDIPANKLTPSSQAADFTAAYKNYIAGVGQNPAKRTYADVYDANPIFTTADMDEDATFDVVKLFFADPMAEYESLKAEPRYATLNSEEGAISLKENKNGILEGVIAAEGLTFWLDTANTADEVPTFFISKGIAADTTTTKAVEAGSVRNFLYFPADSAYHWDAASAAYVSDKKYTVDGTEWVADDDDNSDLKAIFRPAALMNSDTLNTVAGGKDVVVTKKNGLNNFKFYIVKAVEDEGYKILSANDDLDEFIFLYNLNGKLAFTHVPTKAMEITLGEGDPTANEAIEAESGIEVIGGQGVVTVQGAAGKVITVANILGQTIANQVAASDNVTIAAPAGIVVVAVDGEATKVIVK